MLGLNNRFEKGQFVQEISFKHHGLPRTDLGIERFGFIQSHAIVARDYHEYNVTYAGNTNENSGLTLEYCLRSLTEAEVKEKLAYIANHQMEFKQFIVKLNECVTLAKYHIVEEDVIKKYRDELTIITLTMDSTMKLNLNEFEIEKKTSLGLTID